MKLRDVFSVIDGRIRVSIFVGGINTFAGRMEDAIKEERYDDVGMYLDCEVIKMNVISDILIIAV